MVLIPQVRKAVSVPLIAAGGIGTGASMAAAFALGADAVQIGSRFVATPESSAHQNFKDAVIKAKEGDTVLTLKQLTPVRLIKNEFYQKIQSAESQGAGPEKIAEILGRKRKKKGMFEGDMNEGELEIGQISGAIDSIQPAGQIVEEIMNEFNATIRRLSSLV